MRQFPVHAIERASSMKARAVPWAAVVGAALVACAPDAWKPSAGFDGFLNQVQNACYYQRIGVVNVGDMLTNPGNMQSTYFIDQTSRLYYGKVTRSQWTSGVTAFIQGRDSDPGVQCVLEQLDKARATQVAPPPPSK
jgi:hypothetical protein